jgi:hypothetical protein
VSAVSFPLYVFEKDDWSMLRVESPDGILHRLEAIDIEGGEYLFWDANGQGVRIAIDHNKVTGIGHRHPEMTLAEAFTRHSEAFGLNVDTTGDPEEVWLRLKEAEGRLPRGRRILSKLFGGRDTC